MPSSRLLTAADLAACVPLATDNGWNQTEADWRALLRANPDGCIGIEADGRIVATATAIVTPHQIGWIGMVLTHPAYRGRGYATQLLQESIAYLERRALTIKLDATHLGEPLYRKLGFLPEAPIERWARDPKPFLFVDNGPAGTYRAIVPPVVIDASWECAGAFCATRAGAVAQYLGPCQAEGKDAARRVIGAMLLTYGEQPIYWDLFPSHPAAELAREFGFSPRRHLLRMYRGDAAPTAREVFAISGFEWG